MRYVLITEDGALEVQDGDYRAAVGPEGPSRVHLSPAYRGIAAFVNDCGLILPDRYRRNVVGSVLLTTMGARVMPYAGPVVITNWCIRHEVEGIRPEYQRPIEQTHTLILAVLAGQTPEGQNEDWVRAVREFAALVPVAAVPPIQIISGVWPAADEPGSGVS